MAEKSNRLQELVSIINSGTVQSQEELQQLLSQRGFECTQATLSRDLKEVGAVKLNTPAGVRYSILAPAASAVGSSAIVSIKATGTIAVVRTLPGHASAVAALIDKAANPSILGTIAGDDTVFVAFAESCSRQSYAAIINEIGV